jgi:hypothetical protein
MIADNLKTFLKKMLGDGGNKLFCETTGGNYCMGILRVPVGIVTECLTSQHNTKYTIFNGPAFCAERQEDCKRKMGPHQRSTKNNQLFSYPKNVRKSDFHP